MVFFFWGWIEEDLCEFCFSVVAVDIWPVSVCTTKHFCPGWVGRLIWICIILILRWPRHDLIILWRNLSGLASLGQSLGDSPGRFVDENSCNDDADNDDHHHYHDDHDHNHGEDDDQTWKWVWMCLQRERIEDLHKSSKLDTPGLTIKFD